MNRITLDSGTYNDAALYARLHNISVADALRAAMKSLMQNFAAQEKSAADTEYYISPKVKALETGFRCPENLSTDYKKELSDALMEKYS